MTKAEEIARKVVSETDDYEMSCEALDMDIALRGVNAALEWAAQQCDVSEDTIYPTNSTRARRECAEIIRAGKFCGTQFPGRSEQNAQQNDASL